MENSDSDTLKDPTLCEALKALFGLLWRPYSHLERLFSTHPPKLFVGLALLYFIGIYALCNILVTSYFSRFVFLFLNRIVSISPSDFADYFGLAVLILLCYLILLTAGVYKLLLQKRGSSVQYTDLIAALLYAGFPVFLFFVISSPVFILADAPTLKSIGGDKLANTLAGSPLLVTLEIASSILIAAVVCAFLWGFYVLVIALEGLSDLKQRELAKITALNFTLVISPILLTVCIGLFYPALSPKHDSRPSDQLEYFIESYHRRHGNQAHQDADGGTP